MKDSDLTIEPGRPLRGRIAVQPDKSLTHRALLLGALAAGRSRIRHPNAGEDCRATAGAVEALGARVRFEAQSWSVTGTGGRLREPEDVLDLGNSGTGLRLLAGTAAAHPILVILTGDASLRGRPMERIAVPLRRMGAQILARDGGRAPIVVRGGGLKPIAYDLPVASAQVKSALLLAGLGAAEGEMALAEPALARDHTERMLAYLGVPVTVAGLCIRMRTPAAPRAFDLHIPGDPSAAAFYIVAACITPGSEVCLEDVGLNPRRTGAFEILERMGAGLRIAHSAEDDPEPRGTIEARHGALRGIEVRQDPATFVDEVPILAVAAAFAEGETVFHGLSELRHKESDRLATTAQMIRSLGGEVEETPGGLRVRGGGPAGLAGGCVESSGDHRIAMAALVAGCAARGPVTVRDTRCIATSDPTFVETLGRLRGAPAGR